MSAIADLIGKLIAETRARHPERPALIGVGGAQGSGKSYQCRAYAAAHPRVAHFSLDDVYLTKAERESRADVMAMDMSAYDPAKPTPFPPPLPALRPLFVTRGPPGTHDLGLVHGLIVRLGKPWPTPLPRFDKASDDRLPEETCPVFQGPAQALLIDGWCMGALAPEDGPPLNALEEADVATWRGRPTWPWRASVCEELENQYARFFARFDTMIYLQAPSWEIVRAWRGEQEEETLGRPLTTEENAALDRFVMHYERVTRAMLAGHHGARWIVRLDEVRNVIGIEER